jgi:hypothetical protein
MPPFHPRQLRTTHLHSLQNMRPSSDVHMAFARPSNLNPLTKIGPHIFLNRLPFEWRETGALGMYGRGSRGPTRHFAAYAAWSAREIELQALATLATLAQISTSSAAHFLKSHQLLVQKFAADRDRQRSSFKPFRMSHSTRETEGFAMYRGGS